MRVIAFCAAGLLLFGMSGCAGFGVWSATAQKDIAAFTAWADEWVGGAVAAAPAVIAAAAAIPGVSQTVLADATKAVAAAQGAVKVLDSVATGASTNTAASAETAVLNAIGTVNTTIGAVKAASAASTAPTAGAFPIPVPTATVPVATPATK